MPEIYGPTIGAPTPAGRKVGVGNYRSGFFGRPGAMENRVGRSEECATPGRFLSCVLSIENGKSRHGRTAKAANRGSDQAMPVGEEVGDVD
jgi:hypothetical protein